ncbi:MAG TPA: hypothetical protein PJ986_11440 [Gammaproteobacteria bacterium]|nr:hypothetical protein [Gammaproteobacteria bacterium]
MSISFCVPLDRARAIVLALALFAGLSPFAAAASVQGGLQIEIVDAATGRALPSWQHAGRTWVAGEPGARYALRVRNTTPRRLLAVVSVDGINVLSGESAAYGQNGYVIEAWRTVTIDGWRKSLSEAAAFYFTALPDSYAARTGRPQDVGAIGCAMFEEHVSPPVAPLPSVTARAKARGESAAEARESAAEARESAGDGRMAAAPRLGTGHGERLHSEVTTTSFQRASSTPQAVIAIHYDRLSSLIARDVVPPPAVAEPNPFPQSFVPDPPVM